MRGTISVLASAAVLAGSASVAMAQDAIKIGLCYDLTKAYTFVSPQAAQAVMDYAALLNKGGGINGHKIEVLLEDHGNEPQRGIACYEKMKAAGVASVDMLSSPVSRAIVPRAMKDEIVQISALIGRGDAMDGEVFKWIFPIGPSYWAQSANVIGFLKDKLGGTLEGKKIAYLYPDFPAGTEPLAVLEPIAAKEKFELLKYPYPLPGNDQSSAWSQVRRDRPDFLIHWFSGASQTVAVNEAKRNGYPVDQMVTGLFLTDVDIKNIGAENAKGYVRSVAFSTTADNELSQRILKEIYAEGKGTGKEELVGTFWYNMSLATYATVFEGARLALEGGGPELTSDALRKGMEAIKDYDAAGLTSPLTITASDHGGGGKTRFERWSGTAFVPESDWTASYGDIVWEVTKSESAKFKAENN